MLEDNPNSGFNSFDNFWVSSWTIFQCSTLEGWTDVTEMLMQVSNVVIVLALTRIGQAVGPYCWIYFLVLLLIFNFMITNLFTAVRPHMQLIYLQSEPTYLQSDIAGHQQLICRGAPG